jgi:putative FmdB family regulatory protein
MPLYEYECQQCHRRTEKIQKFSDPELTECPHCAGRLERTITAPAFSFSGGGWYKDLYSSSAKSGASNDSGSGSAPDGKPAASADSGSTPAPGTPAAAPPAAAAPATSAPSSKE